MLSNTCSLKPIISLIHQTKLGIVNLNYFTNIIIFLKIHGQRLLQIHAKQYCVTGRLTTENKLHVHVN